MRESTPRAQRRVPAVIRQCQKWVSRWFRLYRRQVTCNRLSTYLSSHPSALPIFILLSVYAVVCYSYWSLTIPDGLVPLLDDNRGGAGLQDDLLHNPSLLRSQARVESERLLATQKVCVREKLEDNVELLRLCGDFPKTEQVKKKIVALVEVRNVEETIHTFLSSLMQIVHSVVILDDHSTDLTRNAILSFSTQQQQQRDTATKNRRNIIEALVNKTGEWTREELFDRQILLRAGRRVGGTHFVLLDYDEYFSANCVSNGVLQSAILELNPGQSLFIPWVETWKSPRIHAVLRNDPKMNFLRRRQVIIFADDGQTQYTEANSNAKTFTIPASISSSDSSSLSSSRRGSIHVLRCPRTLCPRPPRHATGEKGWGENGNVKVLPECRIIEMRFLNLDNVLLKSAWYEAFGRVMGTEDGLTSGKMVQTILRKFQQYSFSQREMTENNNGNEDDPFSLAITQPNWLEGMEEILNNAHSRVETWRAREIIAWANQHGDGEFAGLDVMSLIDLPELRSAVDYATESGDMNLRKVPRKKIGSLIFAVEVPGVPIVSDLLSKIGWRAVDLSEVLRNIPSFDDSSHGGEIDFQKWGSLVVKSVMRSLRDGDVNGNLVGNEPENAKRVFISCTASHYSVSQALLRVVRNEMSFLKVKVVFGDRTFSTNNKINDENRTKLFKLAASYAMESGSHFTLIDVPLASFGSFTTLQWLLTRLQPSSDKVDNIDIAFAESVHEQYSKYEKFAPVARLIFSLNVGRSGSKYMADVLSTAAEPIIALHEPSCPHRECTRGGAMRMQDQALSTTYTHRANVKRTMIRTEISALAKKYSLSDRTVGSTQWHKTRRSDCAEVITATLRESDWSVDKELDVSWKRREVFEIGKFGRCSVHAVMDGVYVETNPNFKAWFYDVVLDEFPKQGYYIDVIVVRKYVAAVLKSLYETGFFSQKDGYTWMETAAGINTKLNGVSQLSDDSSLDAIDRLLSYIANAEAVFRDITHRYANTDNNNNNNVRFIGVRAENLYGIDGTHQLFERLELKPSNQTWDMASNVHDKYLDGGKHRIGYITVPECERRINRLVEQTGGVNGVVADLLRNWTKVDDFNYHD